MSDLESEVSKTAVKKEMLELQHLGEKIVGLPDVQLKRVPLETTLYDAILAARKITKRGGRKRQLQYIGKLMRHVDPEPIRNALAEFELGHQSDTKLFHKKENWRDVLLSDNPSKLTEFIESYPDTDSQLLRQSIRSFKTAKSEDKKGKLSRQVFQLVAEQLDLTSRANESNS